MIIAVLVIIFIAIPCFGATWQPKSTPPKLLRATFISTLKGDNIVLQTPNNKTIVIYTGDNSHFESITQCLKTQGIQKINILILSRPGLGNPELIKILINCFHVDQCYVVKVKKTIQRLTRIIPRDGYDIIETRMFINIDPTLVIEVLDQARNKNNPYRITPIIKVRYNKTSFLFAGDAGIFSQTKLIKEKFNLKADLLEFGNWGGNAYASLAFVKKISPQYAVVSVRAGNDKNRYIIQTFKNLHTCHAKAYQTEEKETITAASDGHKISILAMSH